MPTKSEWRLKVAWHDIGVIRSLILVLDNLKTTVVTKQVVKK